MIWDCQERISDHHFHLSVTVLMMRCAVAMQQPRGRRYERRSTRRLTSRTATVQTVPLEHESEAGVGRRQQSTASERQAVSCCKQVGDIGYLGVNFRFVPSVAALLLQGRSRAKTPIVGGQSGVSARAARQIMICIRFIAPCAPPGAQEHNCGKDHQELSGETSKGTWRISSRAKERCW